MLLCNLHKLNANRALLLCDIPARVNWQRTSGSSYSLSGRWSRRIKLGLVGLVVVADKSRPRGVHRFQVCLRLFRIGDVEGLAHIQAAIRLPRGKYPSHVNLGFPNLPVNSGAFSRL